MQPPLDPRNAVCPVCKSDVVSVEIQGLYDGAAYRYCPSCDLRWSRRGTPITREQANHLTRQEVHTL
jgi:formate dehydrogenase maturation protein FdhE